jgi:diketogulonate reductase-like aldo/keto reductase
MALDAGFSGIDTANQRKHYFEAAVGRAVQGFLSQTKVLRDELFLQSKFTHVRGQDQRLPYDPKAEPGEQVRQSFASSLEHLQTTHLDSYLLHGPSSGGRLTQMDWEVWRALEALADGGQARFIGISNVSAAQLSELLNGARVRPAFVQNRCYARQAWDREVRRLCAENDMLYQGFSLLTANRSELASPAFRQLEQRTGRSSAELTFRFASAVGMIPLTGTSSLPHMQLDLASLDFELTREDLRIIENVSSV